MKAKKSFSLLIVCVLIMGCLSAPAGAVSSCETITQAIMRATDEFDETIPAYAIMYLGDSISLAIGETITYDCTYTPKSANIKFGFIAPDGLFYGVSGSDGSYNKSIRVSQRGSYTLAIKNSSNSTVTVKGTVNY